MQSHNQKLLTVYPALNQDGIQQRAYLFGSQSDGIASTQQALLISYPAACALILQISATKRQKTKGALLAQKKVF